MRCFELILTDGASPDSVVSIAALGDKKKALRVPADDSTATNRKSLELSILYGEFRPRH